MIFRNFVIVFARYVNAAIWELFSNFRVLYKSMHVLSYIVGITIVTAKSTML